ncbi:hypothetical protein [Lacticaseibacillus brantae]|uniref:hypothetical protein n=1 Tax=Lacticaseibacillus brantae TaxID=943673 RepID=UPI00070ADCAA|nr:hypothetical protein [Lacticaseibacillus brantae]
MNDDLKILLKHIKKMFNLQYHTRYWLMLVDDRFDKTYNFFFHYQRKRQRERSIPLHAVKTYNLEYLEKLIKDLQVVYHFSIIYVGFEDEYWPSNHQLIQRRRLWDE